MRDVEASAPGRVNLIGEHTDYQEGFVLPSVVPQRTRIALAPRSDRVVRAVSERVGGDAVEYLRGAETRRGGWVDYIQGVTWAAAGDIPSTAGFDLRIASDVPMGSGLASSAALEVATLRAIRAAFDLGWSDVAIAKLAHRAEVEFVGAPVGVMDQMVCSLGEAGEALFLDTRTLAFERIALPSAMDLVVVDSGIAHQHASGAYATRRGEAEDAATRLGVSHLRDVAVGDLRRIDALPPVLARRARHIVTENDRVHLARQALRDGDLPRLGELFNLSHASLRDDYEVSTPEVDALVALAAADPDAFGARMTGGGFGGAIVVVAAAGAGAAVGRRVRRAFESRGGRATVLVPTGM